MSLCWLEILSLNIRNNGQYSREKECFFFFLIKLIRIDKRRYITQIKDIEGWIGVMLVTILRNGIDFR